MKFCIPKMKQEFGWAGSWIGVVTTSSQAQATGDRRQETGSGTKFRRPSSVVLLPAGTGMYGTGTLNTAIT